MTNSVAPKTSALRLSQAQPYMTQSAQKKQFFPAHRWLRSPANSKPKYKAQSSCRYCGAGGSFFGSKVLGEPISERGSVHSGRLKLKQSMMYLAIILVPWMSWPSAVHICVREQQTDWSIGRGSGGKNWWFVERFYSLKVSTSAWWNSKTRSWCEAADVLLALLMWTCGSSFKLLQKKKIKIHTYFFYCFPDRIDCRKSWHWKGDTVEAKRLNLALSRAAWKAKCSRTLKVASVSMMHIWLTLAHSCTLGLLTRWPDLLHRHHSF